MYSILIAIALAAYALILADFTLLFQEISVNADLLTSTQALYAAEGAAEQSFYGARSEGNAAQRNSRFIGQALASDPQGPDDFLVYNEEAGSSYIRRQMTLNGQDLTMADATVSENRIASQTSTLAAGNALDPLVLYAMEPKATAGFPIREVPSDQNFNSIEFSYNRGTEHSSLLFEVFAFPREGDTFDFLDFDRLKSGVESSVSRLSINTLDDSQNGKLFVLQGQPFVVHFNRGQDPYQSQLSVSGFQPLSKNYMVRFQTLDNKSVHYTVSATYNGQRVRLPSITQTVDVIGTTPTGLFQRVKMQRQTEEGLMPGLQFVHFTDAPLNK